MYIIKYFNEKFNFIGKFFTISDFFNVNNSMRQSILFNCSLFPQYVII